MLMTMVWVRAHEEPETAWWGEATDRVLMAACWRGMGGRPGEDGSPVCHVRKDGLDGIIGVFDGLGGAGARPAWLLEEAGDPLAGAHVASHVASLATLAWYARTTTRWAGGLHEAIHDALTDAERESNLPKPRFSGTAMRTLPTTVAVIEFRTMAANTIAHIQAMWAGDSRCYMLEPERGLARLSMDDLPADDALEALRDSPVMTNVAGVDRPFTIHSTATMASPPVVLLVVTDGFTDFIEAPHQLELELLRALADSGDTTSWAETVARRISATAQDDATMVAVGLGFDGFADLQARFAGRLEALQALDSDTIGRADPGDRDSRTQAANDAWAQYRADYERIVPRREAKVA